MKVVRLLKNEKRLSREEYRRFSKGDLIFGENACPEELNRWNIDDLEEAKKELKKYRCTYEEDASMFNVTEYAIEIFEEDEDGEFVEGSYFQLTAEE